MKNNSNIFFKVIKWLYPGMRVKRWIALLTLAVVLITFGSARLLVEPSVFYRAFYILAIFAGVFLGVFLSTPRIGNSTSSSLDRGTSQRRFFMIRSSELATSQSK